MESTNILLKFQQKTGLLLMLYSDLIRLLSLLEGKYLGNGTRSVSGVPASARYLVMDRDNVQYFAADCSRACPEGVFSSDVDASVVVAIGANYSQDARKLPDRSPSQLIKVWPFVEARLGLWRSYLDSYFKLYESGGLSPVWSTEDGYALPLYPQENQPTLGNYHLILANFSPWITTLPWSQIRNQHSSEATTIFAYPPHGSRTFVEFEDLRRLLPEDTLWMGHGNYDVHSLFMELVGHFSLANWFFRSNLTFRLPNSCIAPSTSTAREFAS